jgi:hypothetical protein
VEVELMPGGVSVIAFLFLFEVVCVVMIGQYRSPV